MHGHNCTNQLQALRRLRVCLLRAHFSSWRAAWGSQLLWKEREAKVEAKRSMALVDLRSREIEDLVREQGALRDNINDASSALERMSEAVRRKEGEVEEYSSQLKKREEIIEALQSELRVAKERLEDCMAERNRLRVLEEVRCTANLFPLQAGHRRELAGVMS
jgi:DNA repair exonuclease SbcCD ATPase subunit